MNTLNSSYATWASSIEQAPVLVLGLGNVLIGDEGVGIAAIEYIDQLYRLPKEVELLDGGTSGMALLDDLRQRRKLIVIDAVRTGAPPGTLVVLKGDEVPAFFRSKVSPHQLALSDVLAALTLTGDNVFDIMVIGVVPISLETRIGLSERVAVQLQPIAEIVKAELETAGYSMKPVLHGQINNSDSLYSLRAKGGNPL